MAMASPAALCQLSPSSRVPTPTARAVATSCMVPPLSSNPFRRMIRE